MGPKCPKQTSFTTNPLLFVQLDEMLLHSCKFTVFVESFRVCCCFPFHRSPGLSPPSAPVTQQDLCMFQPPVQVGFDWLCLCFIESSMYASNINFAHKADFMLRISKITMLWAHYFLWIAVNFWHFWCQLLRWAKVIKWRCTSKSPNESDPFPNNPHRRIIHENEMMEGFHSPFHLQKRDPVPVPLLLFTKKSETKPYQLYWFSGIFACHVLRHSIVRWERPETNLLDSRLRSAHIRSLASSDCSQLCSLFFHVGHATNHVEGCLHRTNLASFCATKKKKQKPQAANSLLAAVVKEGIQSVLRVYELTQL